MVGKDGTLRKHPSLLSSKIGKPIVIVQKVVLAV